MMNLIPMRFQEHEVHVVFDTHGNPWWLAHFACEVLGLGNVGMAIGRLDADEKKIINVDESRPGRKNTWHVNEAGLYHLILTSRKPEARAFRRWLTHEVLPELCKTGHYQLTQETFLANMERPTQVQQSKDIGALQSRFGGRGDCIRWYRKSLHGITGAYPKEWREMGRVNHLPGWVCRRGREVVCRLQPAGACATSLADDPVVHGIYETDAIEIGQESTALFQRILVAGATLAELLASPLEGAGDEFVG
jgi:prophage antirepressor-like protein